MREFILRFREMPKGTNQMKRYNSRTGIYFKDKKLQTLENEFIYALKPYAPVEPSDKPIKLFVSFAFDIKQKKLWGKYKATRPDLDNYVKTFVDCMVKAGYFKDDAQIVKETMVKTYAENAEIYVRWEEIYDT